MRGSLFLLRKKQPIRTFYVSNCYDDLIASYEVHSSNIFELGHQNFGWGGSLLGNATRIAGYDGSGWYRLDVFNSRTGRKNASNTYKSDSQGNYKYHNDILINIK